MKQTGAKFASQPPFLFDPLMFVEHRERLASLLPPKSLAVINNNDLLPTNADASIPLVVQSDLFYLSGIEQEQTILLLHPHAKDEASRAILFIRAASPEKELWEGRKLTFEMARGISGIQQVHYLEEFPRIFHRLMCATDHVFLNSNEHSRADNEVETRDERFISWTRRRYPLHDYRRLAPLLHGLRAVKSQGEVLAITKACAVTRDGFLRVARHVKPGVTEYELEAEYAHEFIRHQCRFAYPPIIASGSNACCLHYQSNSSACQDGDLLLLDVAARCRNYNADLTRTIPVNGRFTPRQKQVYKSVLRVLRQSIRNLKPGKTPKTWQREAESLVEKELVDLGLLSMREIKRPKDGHAPVKKYFMHGIGHSLGLDVHDVAPVDEPMRAGWVMTVEPGIYIPEEGMGIRLENDVLITSKGARDLMEDVPIEPDEIEDLMSLK